MFNVNNLNELDPTIVEQNTIKLETLIQESFPQLDVKTGVIRDLLIRPSGILSAAISESINKLKNFFSIEYLLKNAESLDKDFVDAFAKNFNLNRNVGNPATGQILILLNQKTPSFVFKNSIFRFGDFNFLATENFNLVIDITQIQGPNDRLILATTNNEFFTIIDAISEKSGKDKNIKHGTELEALNPPINFVKAIAYGDFYGGDDDESNENFLKRIRNSFYSPSWLNRSSIESLIYRHFPRVSAVSIIGQDSPLMRRDLFVTWPGSSGGKIDVYVKTSNKINTKVLIKQATLVSKVGSKGNWQITVSSQDAPAFYEIKKIYLLNNFQYPDGFYIINETRSLNLDNDFFTPYFPDTLTGVYSPFQTTTVDFYDDITETTTIPLGYKKDYQVVVSYIPEILEIHKKLTDSLIKPLNYDILFKAPVPCELSVFFKIISKKVMTSDVINKIKESVAEEFNKINFVENIPASVVYAGVDKVIKNEFQSIIDVVLQCRIRQPNGIIWTGSATNQLTLPQNPENLIDSKNIAVFCDPKQVYVSVQSD